jgi:hypothetical protein
MKNVADLKANIIIGDNYEGFLVLEAWKGFQSRQGAYGSQDKEGKSDGRIKVTIEGVSIDYVKVSSPAQVAAIRYLVDHAEEIKVSLLNGLLDKFPSWKEIYEEYLPEVSEIGQFRDLIGISWLHVMSAEKEGYAYIGFELGCTWDEEHGAGVMMHKERVIEIGQADTSFNAWATSDDNGTTEIEQVRWDAANAKIAPDKGEKKTKTKPWWQFWR